MAATRPPASPAPPTVAVAPAPPNPAAAAPSPAAPNAPEGPSPTNAAARWIPRVALLAILVGAALLVGWNVGREGLSNDYYAAAVRSMLDDPVAFLFGGFDAGRYITLDKPPLGYQLQAVSAAVLGFNGVALLLPQLVASVLSVGLLYALVRPAWGAGAGLVGAVALALTPVSVAVARNTTVDATLVAVLLAAALALQRGLRTGRARWLGLAFALVGVGFDLKMLQAYLVLPAFAAAWVAAARGSLPARLRQLAIAVVPLAIVSFAWPTVVALWPADDRPWIGGSPSNSLFDLAFGYNGLERLATGRAWGDIGTAGPLRFLDPALAGQVGWLLPAAALGVVLALPGWRRRSIDRIVDGVDSVTADAGRVTGDAGRVTGDAGRAPGDTGLAVADAVDRLRLGSLVLWAGWLLTCLVFFSVARFWHRHYLVIMAPAVVALAGIGATLGWRAFRRAGAAGWLPPIVVVLGGLLAALTIAHGADLRWLAVPTLLAGLALGAGLGIVRGLARLVRGRARTAATRAGAVVAGLALVAALVPPGAWSVWTVAGDDRVDPTLPTGGPPIVGIQFGPIDGGGGGDGRAFDPRPDPAVLAYVTTHRGDATWILAVEGGLQAAPLIIETGQPVMAIGGFQGRDPAISLDGFRWLVRQGRIRFASAGEKFDDGPGPGASSAAGPGATPSPAPVAADVVLDWVVVTCAKVAGFETLYDCAGR